MNLAINTNIQIPIERIENGDLHKEEVKWLEENGFSLQTGGFYKKEFTHNCDYMALFSLETFHTAKGWYIVLRQKDNFVNLAHVESLDKFKEIYLAINAL